MLALEAVSVAYGRLEVLLQVTLRISAGEIVALIGPNGAGKTTLLRAISGLAPVVGGQIVFDGRRIDTLPTYQIAGLGIAHVPEGRLVFGDQSVEDNLRLGAFQRYFRAGRREVERDIARVGERFPILGQRRQQLAGLLSGGEQQQLAIARGLMARPRLLLVDEPSLGLAPAVASAVFETLNDVKREGVAVLLVEQRAHQALQIADRGYVLQAGRIRLEGASGELLSNPEVTQAYLGRTRGGA